MKKIKRITHLVNGFITLMALLAVLLISILMLYYDINNLFAVLTLISSVMGLKLLFKVYDREFERLM